MFAKQMGVAAIVHLYVFPAVPYKRGERCVRNVAVMTDYASLGTPPDPEEVQDCERYTRMRLDRHYEREKRLNFPQSVRDVVLGSGEIVRLIFLHFWLDTFSIFLVFVIYLLFFILFPCGESVGLSSTFFQKKEKNFAYIYLF